MLKITDLILTAKKIEEKTKELKTLADYHNAAKARMFKVLSDNGMYEALERSGLIYEMAMIKEQNK